MEGTPLQGLRFAVGIILGAMVPIGVMAAFIGYVSGTILWQFYLVGGIVYALLLVPMIVVPASRFLYKRKMLTVLWAIFLGGLVSVVPLLPVLAALGLGGKGNSASQYVGAIMTPMIVDGKLTAAGWYQYFVVQPSYMFPFGAMGGLLAWLIAVGWRFRA